MYVAGSVRLLQAVVMVRSFRSALALPSMSSLTVFGRSRRSVVGPSTATGQPCRPWWWRTSAAPSSCMAGRRVRCRSRSGPDSSCDVRFGEQRGVGDMTTASPFNSMRPMNAASDRPLISCVFRIRILEIDFGPLRSRRRNGRGCGTTSWMTGRKVFVDDRYAGLAHQPSS